MTNAIAGYGTTLERDGNVIAELTSITGPEKTADELDVTNFSSPDGYREKIAGFKNGGSVNIEGNFIAGDTDGQIGLNSDFDLGTLQNFVITFRNGATWTFSGVVTKAPSTSATFDGKVSFTATIAVSGKPLLGASLSVNVTTLAYEDSVGAKTSIPVFAPGTYNYSLTINTASGYVMVTVTDATAASIIARCMGITYSLTSTVQSGQIAVDAAGSVTTLTITVTDTGKSPKVYTILVVRP